MDVRTKRRDLLIFYYIFYIYGFSFIIIHPLLPIIANQIDVGFDRIGIALLIGSASALISSFSAGSLSDRLDNKKLIMLGLSLLCVAFTIFGSYLNYISFIFVIILLRAGFGIIDAVVHSFSSKLFKKNISRIFLNLNLSWYSGAFVGPLVISIILYFNFSPRYLFFILVIFYGLLAVIFYRTYPKRKIQKNGFFSSKEMDFSFKKYLEALKDPAVIMGSLTLFFYMGSTIGLSSWMTTYFLGIGLNTAYGSAVLSLYWFFSSIGLIIISRIISRFREITILFFGCLAGTACLFIFSSVHNVYIKIVALIIQAILFVGIFPLVTAILVKRKFEKSGTILGFNLAFSFAGSMVFQPLFGYVAEYFGENYIPFIALTGTLIGLIFAGLLFRIINQGV